MCGICGVVDADRDRPALEAVEAMNQALVHRGPDSGGVWSMDGAALGARRLRIRDLDAGDQPMVSRDGRYVMVFNGEIYNAEDLRSELESKGAAFTTRCDTEVVLEAFALWGPESVERLNGMFAIAVWDTVERRLTLTRGRLGIKPLYLTTQPGSIVFSSELDSLMQSRRIERNVSPPARRERCDSARNSCERRFKPIWRTTC